MLVVASAVVTVLIVVAIVAGLGILFVALGPLSRREELRDQVGAELGPMGTSALKQEALEELRDEDTGAGPDAEERLDEENE